MSLQIRRGLDKYRLTYIPAEAELVYITDTKKLYVGDGYTAGGILITGTLSSTPPPTTQPPTTQPPTTQPPTTQPPTTQPPTTQPPTTSEPPWNQQEIITSSVQSPKVRQSFQISISHGRPNSTFSFTEQGTSDTVTKTLSSEGSTVLDVANLNQAKTYTFDVHFDASNHNKVFSITVSDYNEQVNVNGTIYDSQTFNFEFTECEPGSIVSLEKSSDAVDYSFYGNLQGTIDDSGNLTASYSDSAGYWYYRFTFSSSNHTRDLALQIYSNAPYDYGNN
jgi:hypothetical protein